MNPAEHLAAHRTAVGRVEAEGEQLRTWGERLADLLVRGGRLLADMGGQLLTLRFGREDESEADLVGLELAARGGYDPRAGVTLCRRWRRRTSAERSSC